jgi:hypothetical protein
MRAHRFPGKSEFTLVVTFPPESEPHEIGELAIELSSGEMKPIETDRRNFRIFRAIVEAAIRDLGTSMRQPGVRSRARLAQLYAEQAAERAPKSEEVITHYVSAFRKLIRNAVEELIAEGLIDAASADLEVIKTVRQRGYGLGDISVLVIDHTAPDASPER